MGEAAKRRAVMRDTDGGAAAAIDRDKLAKALRITLAPVSAKRGTHGTDCLLYASVGAEVPLRLGLSAQLRISGAKWRVGPGDGDVIHNAAGCGGYTFGPSARSRVFHAWVRIEACCATPAQLVDFTTWQLRDKGRRLDRADGGHTQVEFCLVFCGCRRCSRGRCRCAKWAPATMWAYTTMRSGRLPPC